MTRYHFGLGPSICFSFLLILGGCSKVPDLTGMTKAEVDDVLKSKKLKPGAITAVKQGKTAGTVVDQDPKPGAKVPEDKTIALVFEPGPGVVASTNTKPDGDSTTPPVTKDPSQTISTVPALAGKTQLEAEQSITTAGLARGTVEAIVNDQAEGKVFDQDPPAATQVKAGTIVNIKIASNATVKVPAVIGMAQKDAEAGLRAAQLTVGDVTQVVAGTPGAVGSVITQNPNANLQVARGTPVAMQIKQESTSVPRVVNLNSKDAQISLFQAGLQPFQSKRYIPALAAALEGTIVEQTVAPGTLVAKGSPVGIVIQTAIPTKFIWSEVMVSGSVKAATGMNAMKLYKKN